MIIFMMDFSIMSRVLPSNKLPQKKIQNTNFSYQTLVPNELYFYLRKSQKQNVLACMLAYITCTLQFILAYNRFQKYVYFRPCTNQIIDLTSSKTTSIKQHILREESRYLNKYETPFPLYSPPKSATK